MAPPSRVQSSVALRSAVVVLVSERANCAGSLGSAASGAGRAVDFAGGVVDCSAAAGVAVCLGAAGEAALCELAHPEITIASPTNEAVIGLPRSRPVRMRGLPPETLGCAGIACLLGRWPRSCRMTSTR